MPLLPCVLAPTTLPHARIQTNPIASQRFASLAPQPHPVYWLPSPPNAEAWADGAAGAGVWARPQLLAQLEHFTEEQQQSLAVALCLIFTMKLGIPPENLMKELLQDELVAKGTMLRFVTSFFKANLHDAPVEDLIALLRKGRVEDLMLFFPMQKRSPEDFKKHFTQAGLPA